MIIYNFIKGKYQQKYEILQYRLLIQINILQLQIDQLVLIIFNIKSFELQIKLLVKLLFLMMVDIHFIHLLKFYSKYIQEQDFYQKFQVKIIIQNLLKQLLNRVSKIAFSIDIKLDRCINHRIQLSEKLQGMSRILQFRFTFQEHKSNVPYQVLFSFRKEYQALKLVCLFFVDQDCLIFLQLVSFQGFGSFEGCY
ncbi:hypothetical protein TTHERM_000535729 (macronuclear) [Tetrahymena thermophila SB210]|uniref:Uncharacterized protein n=1 Tax=Tetrahymena thermophila (strain SB210) TaxID=312017 RepID=W7XE47_TETTS|nr:hypothetical protein TTHERM_000535729 [Tetrahymena thermophila SB210]EWS72211.1 hypothetical protein TTHERM_000535729 [Tetrahymena thermophila SB210]|eukprot:XP_012655254.1 hypothetical protein TTHERM_000535729 [Tetrahymena thermophila SB210]